MKIGIDAHSVGTRQTGNETYTRHLVKQLSLLPGDDFEYVVYFTSPEAVENPFFFNPRFASKLIRPANPFLRIPLAFPLALERASVDIFHAQYILPPYVPCKSVLTVHDVCYERFPKFFTSYDYVRNRILVPWSAKRADLILTVSEMSKRDIEHYYGISPDRIVVSYPGIADHCCPVSSDRAWTRLAEGYRLTDPFILYVGNLQPRKNVASLVRAYNQLRSRGRIEHKLVIVGRKAWLFEDVFAAVAEAPRLDDIIFTGYVPTEDLPYFYSAASAFVFPSFFEGFGSPVVEAMACGAPTITSRGSALEEVAGDGAVLIDPFSLTELSGAMELVANDSDLQNDLRQRGLARSKRFSYRETAELTRKAYSRLS